MMIPFFQVPLLAYFVSLQKILIYNLSLKLEEMFQTSNDNWFLP